MERHEKTTWGPPVIAFERRNRGSVISFPGNRLKEVADISRRFWKKYPEVKRPTYFPSSIAAQSEMGNESDKNTGAEARFQDGLDILNQLALVGRTAADVESVVVFEDPEHLILKEEGQINQRIGAGLPHRFYEIVWIRKPYKKPILIAPSIGGLRLVRGQVARGQTEELRKREREEARIREGAEEERLSGEIETVEAVVLDHVAQNRPQEVEPEVLQNLN